MADRYNLYGKRRQKGTDAPHEASRRVGTDRVRVRRKGPSRPQTSFQRRKPNRLHKKSKKRGVNGSLAYVTPTHTILHDRRGRNQFTGQPPVRASVHPGASWLTPNGIRSYTCGTGGGRFGSRNENADENPLRSSYSLRLHDIALHDACVGS